jgi:hypothetical protein
MEADGLGLASQEQLWGDEESCYSGTYRSRGRHSGNHNSDLNDGRNCKAGRCASQKGGYGPEVIRRRWAST